MKAPNTHRLMRKIFAATSCIIFLSVFNTTLAQTITGETSPCDRTIYPYVFSDDVQYTSTSWTVTGGTIMSGSGNSRNIRWTAATGTLSIAVYNNATYLYTTSLNVTRRTPGTISGSNLVCSGQAVNLSRTGSIGASFTWQSSPQGANTWTNFGAGGTTATFTVTQNTDFRVVLNDCTTNNISTIFTVSLIPTQTAGSISGSTATLCSGASPGLLSNVTSPTGQNSSINWQRSIDGGSSWSDISGATSLDYSPGALTQSTQFRRKAVGCGSTVYSNVLSIPVDQPSNAGTLTSSVTALCNTGSVFLSFTSNPTGAVTGWNVRSKDGSGSWSAWTAFSSANQLTNSYSVSSGSGVDRTYEFNVTVQNGVCSSTTGNTLSVVVNPLTSVGVLAISNSVVCNSGTVNFNFSTTPIGSVTNWLVRSKDGAGTFTSWTSFSLANQLTNSYSVSASATQTRTYEFVARVKSGSCAETEGNVVSVLVHPASVAGTLSYSSAATMCASGTVNLNLSATTVGTITNWYVRSKDGAGAFNAWTSFSTSPSLANTYGVSSSTSVNRTYEFKADVVSGTCSLVTSNTVSMVVNPSSVAGTINISGATEWYTISGSNTLSATGSVGTLLYESSTNGTTWSNTGPNFSGLTITTQFRNKVTSGVCATVYSTPKTIYIYPSPSIIVTGPTSIPVGGSTQLSTQSYAQYQWVKDGVDIAGATSQSYVVKEPGAYAVKVKGSATASWATAIAVTISSTILSQNQMVNYMVVTNLYKQGATTSTNLYSLQSNEVRQVISYLDGYGRTLQQNSIGMSTNRKDIIQPVAYDFDGRQEYSYLPYAASTIDGRYVPLAINDQNNFYQTLPGLQSGSYPYAKSVFDNTPLSRVIEQGAPGADWQPGSTHTVRSQFNTNNAAYTDAALKNVRRWTTAGPVASPNAFYLDNQLGIAVTTDENGNKTWIFTDKLGRTVLKRVQLDETLKLDATDVATPFLETYYVYDDRGNLAMQVPPKATAYINNGTAWSITFRNKWCFVYTYDERNRLIEKKVPDAGAVFYVYDKLDRLVLIQDAVLRKDSSKWIFVKYDIKGRPIMNGIYKHSSDTTQQGVQTYVNPWYTTGTWYETNDSTYHGYTNSTFPKKNFAGTELRVLNINYYDKYDFDNQSGDDCTYTSQGISGEGSQFRSFDLPTGSKRLVIGEGKWLYSYVFYDKYGRVIQVRSNNHLSSTVNNLTTNIYDFEGKVIQTVQFHTNGTTPVTINRKLTYDHAGRLLRVNQKIDAGAEITVAEYKYNEAGQLLDKLLVGPDDSYLQSVDYTYNIRGWLKSINDTQMANATTTNDNNDLFGFELAHNNVITGLNDQVGDSRYYNGNISASRWRLKVDGTAQYDDQKGYKFNYDKSDRLKTAKYRGYKNAAWTHEQDIYNETMTYDHNGNILTLQRNRAKRGTTAFSVITEAIDNLTYTYASGSGNKLIKVEDATANILGFKNGDNSLAEYVYNSNGSMLKDFNKGINNTTYNELGKPTEILLQGGKKIVYTYDGAGNKLTVKNYNGTTLLSRTDYIDGFIYENSTLAMFGSPEGRVVKNGANYEYQFAIGDHQNNTRMIIGKAFEGANLLTAQAECATTTGFSANGSVSISAITINGENYVRGITNQSTSTPGIYPIGGAIQVEAGAKYTFKLKGYTEGSNAWIYIQSVSGGGLIWKGVLLPSGSANETWVSNELTIPTGTTQIYVGVLFDLPALNSAIFLNKVGLYKHSDDDFNAGFESANQTAEQGQFNKYIPTKINNSAVYARTGTSSYLLNANSTSNDNVVGPAKSIRVYAGDVIRMQVYAKYLAPTSTSSGAGAILGAAINGAFGNVAGTGTDAAFQAVSSLFVSGPLIGTALYPAESGTAPKAYLNYILFDDNYVPYDFGYDQVGVAGALPGGIDKMSLEAKVRKPGFIYVYLSNENPTIAEVYFDDLSIKHVKTPILQYNDYYAYGMQTGNSWTRTGTTNNFLYNEGSEQNATSANYDHFFRNYDPALARFVQVDPLASKYHSWSTYNYAYADPVYYTDPTGAGGDAMPKRVSLADEAHYRNMFGVSPGVYGADEIWSAAGMSYSNGMAAGFAEKNGVYGKIKIDWNKLPGDPKGRPEGTIVTNQFGTWKIVNGKWVDLSDSEQLNNRVVYENTQEKDPQDGRPKLKGPGNFYRDQMGSETGKDMFERYWLGQGDMVLTKVQFNEIAELAKLQGADKITGTQTTFNGSPATAKVISFYGTIHANSLGSATVYYDSNGNAIGFYDYFNFDSKPFGTRSFSAEIKTFLVNLDGQYFGAKPFKITYP